MFSCEFCEICKNTFFAEHHRTTASYYSSINGNEGRIGKRNCKLWYKIKAYVPIWARSVSYQKRAALVKFEAVVHRFSSKQVFLKFSQIPKENTCVGDTFLKGCNPEDSVKKRHQHRRFPAKFATYLRTPIFTEQFQWLLLTFNLYFQRIPERKPVQLLVIHTRFKNEHLSEGDNSWILFILF